MKPTLGTQESKITPKSDKRTQTEQYSQKTRQEDTRKKQEDLRRLQTAHKDTYAERIKDYYKKPKKDRKLLGLIRVR